MVGATGSLLLPSPLWGGVGGGGDRAPNDLKHAINVSKHVVIPEAQDTIALRFEKLGALQISVDGFSVLPAINLNDQPGLMARKIDNVRAQPHLPPEMRAIDSKPRTQMTPEFLFCVSRLSTHCARADAIQRND